MLFLSKRVFIFQNQVDISTDSPSKLRSYILPLFNLFKILGDDQPFFFWKVLGNLNKQKKKK